MPSFRRSLRHALHAALLFCAAWVCSGEPAPESSVACIGDSITAGLGLPKDFPTYPQHLAARLGPTAHVRNFGASGRCLLSRGNAPYIRTKEWTAAQDFRPDTVVLMLGTNDSKAKNFVFIDDFVADATALVRVLGNLPSRPRVYLGLPPPAYKEIFGINEPNLIRIRELLRTVAEQEQLPVIDLFAALSGHPECFPDGVHPDARGAELIADTVFAALSSTPPPTPAAPGSAP